MPDATVIRGEREKATTAGWLVMASINRNTGITTIQQRPDATVTDKQHIARPVPSQDVLDLANNAQLRINRSLPAPNADGGFCEKLIGHGLELVRHQEARRRSVVFMHRFPNLDVDVQLCGNDLGGLDRLALSAADDLRRCCEPSRACQGLRARPPDLTQAPGWHRHSRINPDFRMGQIAYELCHD